MGFDHYDLRLSAPIGEAVAKWLRHRYPRDTAKLVARDTQADLKTVENMLAGHLSAQSLTRLLNAYGWPFLAAVGAATLGETYEQSITRELQEIADERRRLDDMEGGLRGRWAAVLARRALDGRELRLVPPEDAPSGGQSGGSARGVGPDKTRRKG